MRDDVLFKQLKSDISTDYAKRHLSSDKIMTYVDKLNKNYKNRNKNAFWLTGRTIAETLTDDIPSRVTYYEHLIDDIFKEFVNEYGYFPKHVKEEPDNDIEPEL